jgi:hypothetical protein
LRGLNSLACAAVHPCVRRIDVSIAMPFGTHPLRTETGGRSG